MLHTDQLDRRKFPACAADSVRKISLIVAVLLASCGATGLPIDLSNGDLSPTVNCNDGEKNGDETDIDCGGMRCGGCVAGQHCARQADCTVGDCVETFCRLPSCGDGRLNGGETDVDCGGQACNRCSLGKRCEGNEDCLSGHCVSAACAACTLAFAPAVDFSTGHISQSVAVGDLDDDGKEDIVTANYDPGGNGGSVTVLRGDGRGGFGAASDYDVGAGSNEAALGDLDGDGRLDVAVANSLGSATLLRNLGGGLLGQRMDVPITAAYVSVADLDGDKRLDLVFAGTSIGVLRNLGGFRFSDPVYYPIKSNMLVNIAVADLNGDGAPDVAALNASSFVVSVFLNQGMGVLAINHSYATDAGPYRVSTGDVDQDGNPEIVVATTVFQKVDLFQNLGAGRFASAPVRYVVAPAPVNEAILVDLNGDGLPEMVIASERQVLVLMNEDGPGRFQASFRYKVTDNVFALASADFDRDGKLDLVVTNAPTTTVSVLLNRCQ